MTRTLMTFYEIIVQHIISKQHWYNDNDNDTNALYVKRKMSIARHVAQKGLSWS